MPCGTYIGFERQSFMMVPLFMKIFLQIVLYLATLKSVSFTEISIIKTLLLQVAM